ncbi:MAG: chromosome partitioning protein [Candidatus Dormibacteria bacterium]
MALLPLCSVKGAPGVTTVACALGAVWPRERPTPIVVECDPAGGDLAARFGLEVTPGVVSLTVALEREPDVASAVDRNPLLEHAQQLRGGLQVVVAPTSPEEMRLPLDRLAEDLSILAHAGCDVIADCGRLESWGARERTPIARLIQRAGLVVVVARPTLEEIQHLHAWLPSLHALRVQVLVLLSQRGPYPSEEIAVALDIPVIGTLPFDPAAAAVLSGGGRGIPGRTLALLRAARGVADALAVRLPATAPALPAQPSPSAGVPVPSAERA